MKQITQLGGGLGTQGLRPAASTPWLPALLLVLATALVYQHVRHAGFIWDDDAHLTENPCIIGPLGFAGIWTTSAATYYPLTLTSFWVQHWLWGLNPLPYHLVNVGVHAGCAVVLWRVLLALNVRGAWFGAALWALHPVQVESVAWITELKNTQSCLFFLLAVHTFLKWLKPRSLPEERRMIWYALALVCAAAAILSKSSTVMLPVVLGLCWWWQEGHWRWRNLPWLLPFLVISLAASAWTIWEQQYHSGAIGQEWNQTWPERSVIAGNVVWFYLGKLIWPHPLIFIYPRWQINAGNPFAYLPIIAAAAALLLFWWQRDGWARGAFFAAVYFVVSLVPVLGFFNVYFFRYSFVGDHLQHLASIGPLAFAAAALTVGLDRLPGERRTLIAPAVCSVLGLTFAILTWRQTAMYFDEETLWRTTVDRNPEAWIAHNNLGKLDRPEEALARSTRACESNPRFAEAHNNLAAALLPTGQTDEAIRHLRQAIEIDPKYADARYNLGSALLQLGRPDEAILQLQIALQIKPSDADSHYNLGTAFLQIGRREEAIVNLEKALERKPEDPEVLNNLAWMLATSADPRLRNGRKAVELAQQANKLTSGSNMYITATLAAAYAETGQFTEAIETAQRALALAVARGDRSLAEAIRRHSVRYAGGSPYHE